MEINMKKVHIIYCSIIVLMLIGAAVGAYIISNEYKEAVSLQNAAYENAKTSYDTAHAEFLEEQKVWEQELKDKQEELNTAYAKLQAIYDERQAKKDAEEARWNALSEEEKQAELDCYAYNDMVSYLRENDEEYKKLYVEYSKYLSKDLYNLGKEESLVYNDLYIKKTSIEQAYLAGMSEGN